MCVVNLNTSGPSTTRDLKMVATSTLKNKNAECISELIDRRYEQAFAENELDYWDHCLAEPSLNGSVFEDSACQQLAKMFENCLSRAKKTKLHCSEVLVPEKLTRRIARDVLRLSSGEPCGLRGCVLHIHLELENSCKKLDRIVYDASVVPTFELTLVFKQDGSAWPSLRDFFLIGACFTPGFRHALKLSPGFRLIKKKLYSSSAGTVVEEY
ncbi:DNA damage-inducible transcript 4-like protein isoform X2 [Brienomyrus brachyistius]|uniref:DNA damage-inducible transcript 4-like protein isoform X2 n=1 Tax=Brienomyrus brachyistius TaxID=42636 RepID=UPI0020B29D26|nr:DNA damage-inducible transcript 4-like protein isoform X2 [Brienomyrus brachyistius]